MPDQVRWHLLRYSNRDTKNIRDTPVSSLAPVILFVYARPDHTQRTLDALSANTLSRHTDLIVYADGARSPEDIPAVRDVRSVVGSNNSFKSLTIVERQQNIGLAKNIIGGVTTVCEQFGKAIVLEDDIVTSPTFLNFMNAALDYYEEIFDVWHISGWNYPIRLETEFDTYLWRGMECWGWATWSDRWKHFEKDTEKLMSTFSRKDIRRLNLDGTRDVWAQVKANARKEIDTWAVYWYATMVKHGALSATATNTFVQNIGIDGTGVNCGNRDVYSAPLNLSSSFRFANYIAENTKAVEEVKRFHRSIRSSRFRRVARKLNRFRRSK